MSCVMGLPAPVHNPSCSSPQVLTSQYVFFGSVVQEYLKSVSQLVLITLFTLGPWTRSCLRLEHMTIHAV